MSFSGACLLVFQTCLAPCLADICIEPGTQKLFQPGGLEMNTPKAAQIVHRTVFQCIVEFKIWNTKPAITIVPRHFFQR